MQPLKNWACLLWKNKSKTHMHLQVFIQTFFVVPYTNFSPIETAVNRRSSVVFAFRFSSRLHLSRLKRLRRKSSSPEMEIEIQVSVVCKLKIFKSMDMGQHSQAPFWPWLWATYVHLSYLCIIYHTRASTLQENGIPKFQLASSPTGTTNLQDLWIHQWNKHATNMNKPPRNQVWGCSQAMSPVSRDENGNADIIPKLVGKQVDEDYGFQPPTVAFLLDCVYRYRILNYSVCILISCVYIYIQWQIMIKIKKYIYIYTYICDKVPFQVLKAALRSQSFSTFPIQVREIIANNQLPKPRPRRREVAAGKTQAMMKRHREWGAKSSQGS